MSTSSPGTEPPRSAQAAIWTLRRSRTDVTIAGLCGALGRRWNIDPVLLRVGFALLALSAGIGIVLYLAGWLLLPVEGKDRAPVDDLFGDAARKWPREVWIAVVTITCVLLLTAFGSISPFSIGPAVIIAVVWYFGLYKPRQRSQTSPPAEPQPVAPPPQFLRHPGPPTPFTEAAHAWQQRIAEHTQQGSGSPSSTVHPTVPQPGHRPVQRSVPQSDQETWPTPPPSNGQPAPAYPPVDPPEVRDRASFLATADPVGLYEARSGSPAVVTPPTPARNRRSARRLRATALSLIAVVLGALGLADHFGAAVPPAAYPAVALLVLGLAMIGATWLGRARGLLTLGVVLSLITLGFAVGESTEMPTMTHPTRVYTSAAQFPVDGDTVDVGNLTVDLTRVDLTADASYKATADAGNITVIVPDDVRVIVHYRTDFGSVSLAGQEMAVGTDLEGEFADPEKAVAGQHTLDLDLQVDLGQLQVRR